MSFDTDRIRRAMASKTGKRTAGAVGGVSLGALLALAGPEYFKLREAVSQVHEMGVRIEKLESGNKSKWEAIQGLQEKQMRNMERLTRLETQMELRR